MTTIGKKNRRGRPSKPYRSSLGEEIHGLYHLPDGRWRIISTGERFTEADEQRAIQKYRDTLLKDTVPAPSTVVALPSTGRKSSTLFVKSVTPSPDFWPWLRKLLVEEPEYIAKMTGLPEVAALRHLPLPRDPLSLTRVFKVYNDNNSAKLATKAQTKLVWDRFVKDTGASTLAELTTDKMLDYRKGIEKAIPSPNTRRFHYAKIKTVIAFGLKVGQDPAQIRAALDRAKVLWTAERSPAPKPAPITREEFHQLLEATNEHPWQVWRPWLLVGLNFAMHIGEVCELRWDEINLEAGTYASIRAKTEAHRIPRAATLWPETIAALKALPRKPEFVFTSHYGTKYNRNKRVNSFGEFRTAAKLPGITFDSMRDGAYTAACRLCPDERWARLLAGHRSSGLQDSYVLRNPAIVKPACDAVYETYGPFPASGS